MSKRDGQKRLDLQGIRGVAIAAVIGFHFYPKIFPNGFLGVDLFFVLSGFLMHMLLTRCQSQQPWSLTTNFYIRRFKRILPLYTLIVSITLACLVSLVYQQNSEFRLQNQKSAAKALIFNSNRRHSNEEDYFEKLQIGIDLFTHTWSLSVEVQFYLLAPLIFIIGSFVWTLGFYALIGALSFNYHFFFLSPEDAFNSTFARIWQFLIGMITFLMFTNYSIHSSRESDVEKMKLLESQEHPEKREEKEKKHFKVFSRLFFFFIIVGILVSPIEISANISRPIFTICTGILMLFSSNDAHFLTSKPLTYIGDVSYSLYLIHWPILAWVKLNYGQSEDYYLALFGGLMLSVIVAVAIYEWFEKWHLNLQPQSSALVVFILTSLCVLLLNFNTDNFYYYHNINKNVHSLGGVTNNMTIDDAKIKNNYWNQKDIFAPEMTEPGCVKRNGSKYEYTWCDYQENGTEFKIAVLGNSYARNHVKLIIQECRHRASTISLNSIPACEPLLNTTLHGYYCTPSVSNFVEFIEDTRPDYAFIMTRHISVSANFTEGAENDLEKDKIYLEMKDQLRKMIPFIKKKLYILDSFPNVLQKNMLSVVEDIREGISFRDISKAMITDTDFLRGRVRHSALVKECGDKCELIDYYPRFLNTSDPEHPFTQYFDNRGFIYLTKEMHISAHGLDFVRPIYRDICMKMNK